MRSLLVLLYFLISTAAFGRVDPKSLSKETVSRLEKVPEFKFIQEAADKLGVKVYLFGGTASAFAHYVRWDLEREAGDTKYQKERFDYDFTNIYRGNQDLDIVVDGEAEQARELERVLKNKYPHFVGNKDAWEVRLLQAQIKDKLPLLGNYDFLNQHTDTNSTGMLAINPDEGEIVFRDLFSWDDSKSQFLKDVAAGEIKFLFSKTHDKTSRFKEGRNPAIFAAVRYLAKLAQYEVTEAEGDLKIIKKIIKETNWKEIKNNSYVKHKLEEFGKKVLLNAPDSEYAWNLLEGVGLRKRLIGMDGNREKERDTLSWWMNKEPLRSKKIGSGDGKIAKEIFKDSLSEDKEIIVSHETNSFIAYENITRSSKGKANAFISRRNVNGEAAAFGDGFYTALGMQGARGTNLTIRFKLHSKAREGSDFTFDGGHIVVLNKNALTLIQENLNLSILDFFKLVDLGEIGPTDKGLAEKFKRKFDRISVTSDSFKDAVLFVKDKFKLSDVFTEEFKRKYIFDFSSFSELYDFYISKSADLYSDAWIKVNEVVQSKGYKKEHFKMVEYLIEKAPNILPSRIVEALGKPWWKGATDVVELILKQKSIYLDISLIRGFFVTDYNPAYADYIIEIVGRYMEGDARKVILNTLMPVSPAWSTNERVITELLKYEDAYSFLPLSVPSEFWFSHPELVDKLIEKPESHRNVAVYWLEKPEWAHRKDIVNKIFAQERKNENHEVKKYLMKALLNEHWISERDTLITMIQSTSLGEFYIFSNIIGAISRMDYRDDLLELLEFTLTDRVLGEGNYFSVIHSVLGERKWKKPRHILEIVIEKIGFNDAIIEGVFSKNFWLEDIDILEKFIMEQDYDPALNERIIRSVFSKAFMLKRFDIVEKYFEKFPEAIKSEAFVKYMLSKKYWSHLEEWFWIARESSANEGVFIQYVFSKGFWDSDQKEIEKIIDAYRPDRNGYVFSFDKHLASLVKYTLSKQHVSHRLDLLEKLVSYEMYAVDIAIAKFVLKKEHWFPHSKQVFKVILKRFKKGVSNYEGQAPSEKQISAMARELEKLSMKMFPVWELSYGLSCRGVLR